MKGEDLKLINLELNNYRRFESALIEFPEGVIGILGLNGAGKSTLIEAVAWALYGNETRIVRTSKEDLKRYGAAPSDECAVNLAFDLDGDKYLVTRKMVGKNFQTSAEVKINGKSAATSTKAVTALIEKQLGMDYQAFYTSVFTKQKELNALSILDPSKRKKLILRMLNIDSIDKAIIKVRSDKREFSTRLDEIRTRLIEPDGTMKIDGLTAEIKVQKDRVAEIAKKLGVMAKQKDEMTKELKKLDNERLNQRKLREKHDKIFNKLTECKISIENNEKQQSKIEGDLKKLEKLGQDLKKLMPQVEEWKKTKARKEVLDKLQDDFIRAEGIQQQLKSVLAQKNKYESNLEKSQTELKKFDSLEDSITNCNKALEKVNIELDEHKKMISESMSKKGHLQKETARIEDKLKEIRELGPDSECPTCERPLKDQFEFLEDKFYKELEVRSKEMFEQTMILKASLLQLDDSEKHFEALNKREKFLSSESERYARLEESDKATESELKQTKKQEQNLLDEVEKFKKLKFDPKEYTQINKDYKKLEKMNEQFIGLKERYEVKPKLESELKKLTGAKSKIINNQSKLTAQLNDLGFDKSKQEALETKFDEESNKLNEHNLKLKECENDLKLHDKDINQLTATVQDLKEQEKKSKDYEDKLMYFTKLDNILDKFKNYMISRIAPTLTQFASELFRELTDGRYNRLEVDSDYNVLIYDDGKEFPLERFSGGEEDLANLCLRLAISQVIAIQSGATGPNFVILDEIFGSQDLNRKRNLLAALNGLTTKFRQIFLITHIEDVKEFIEFNIQVTENDDNSSSVTVFS
jgi:exonuclease SbcC